MWTARKNPDLESLKQFVVVFNLTLAAPATVQVPNCNIAGVPLGPSASCRGEACCMGKNTLYWTAQAYIHQTWRGHSSLALSVETTQRATDTGYKSSLSWLNSVAPGVALHGGRHSPVSLDGYRPPQVGQPPASKVLSCHGLLSSLCPWGLGIIWTADYSHRTRQQKQKPQESTSKSGKLERPDNVDRPFWKPARHN